MQYLAGHDIGRMLRADRLQNTTADTTPSIAAGAVIGARSTLIGIAYVAEHVYTTAPQWTHTSVSTSTKLRANRAQGTELTRVYNATLQ